MAYAAALRAVLCGFESRSPHPFLVPMPTCHRASMPPRGSAALVGAGLRHALGHDVVVPLPLATIRRPVGGRWRNEVTPLKGKPETG